jgi:hypothetical protein
MDSAPAAKWKLEVGKSGVNLLRVMSITDPHLITVPGKIDLSSRVSLGESRSVIE